MEYIHFALVDYILFATMISLTIVVGLYFGFCGKQDTTKDYLHGGKNMKVFPVSMSLVASTLSGITLLSLPAEVYMHGTQYWVMILSIILLVFPVNYVYLPVFYKLQLTSVYEYLELRFDKSIRTSASLFASLLHIILIPVTIYAPSLAFSQVTGISVFIVATGLTLTCTFYTTIGGAKAVIWTDTLQFLVTLCTLGFVLVMGTISVGGVSAVWERAKYGDRLNFFNMDLDPTVRSTFWNIVIGNFVLWTSVIGSSQATVQRFLSVPTYSDARRILMVFVVLMILSKSINCFSGLIVYAKYFSCDPLTMGFISKSDQILPYYVMDVAAKIPGLGGLFVAGIVTTTLSTLSTYLNSLAGNIYSDLISPLMPVNTTEKKASTILKVLTIVLGLVCVSLVFVVEKFGSLFQLVLSLNGIGAGPLFGLFNLGMLFPFANKKGAISGLVGGFCFMGVVVIGNLYSIMNGLIHTESKPLYTYGCNTTSTSFPLLNETSSSWSSTTNYTTTISGIFVDLVPEKAFWLFRVSFYYFIPMGAIVTVLIGVIVSWATRNLTTPPVNPDFLSPCVNYFTSKSRDLKFYQAVKMDVQDTIHGTVDNNKEPSMNKLLTK